MLSSIAVKNFGCFDDYHHTVNFNKLNIIVGTNNSGKSTIFRALNLVRWYTTNNQLQWNTPYYELENFKEVVYGHDATRNIDMIIKYEDKGSWQALLRLYNNGSISQGLSKNDARYSDSLHDPIHQTLVKQIWYLSPNRTRIPYRTGVGSGRDILQALSPSGININQYLIERWTDQDPNWDLAQEWFKKIDPQLILLKTPLFSNQIAIETERNDGSIQTSVNLSLQGSGIQNVATIIAGIIFSPKGSTIIIEEPENYLNSRSVEVLVDLFNYAVNELDKQIIITTHSWEILNAYCSDIGEGTQRGTKHVKAKPEDFKLIVLNEKVGENKIQEYDLRGKKYDTVRKYFKDLWG